MRPFIQMTTKPAKTSWLLSALRSHQDCRSGCETSRKLLHNGVVSVTQKLLPHRICVVAIHERARLHVDEIITYIATRCDRIASFAKCAYQNLRIFGMR